MSKNTGPDGGPNAARMRDLFPDGEIRRAKLLIFTKSLLAIRRERPVAATDQPRDASSGP